jgi:hypothetical protein
MFGRHEACFILKTRFDTSITRNDVNGVSLFHLSHLITLKAYLCSQWTPHVEINYFMFDLSIYRLFVLNWGRKSVSLQIMILVYVCSTCGVVELNTRLKKWIRSNDVNGVRLFHLSSLITLMLFLWSQLSPNVKINNFMFDWSIYRLFVVNMC